MSELELLQFLQTNYLRDLKKSPDKFSTHDCVSDEAELVIELKCRRTHYEELLIEKKKFDALVSKAENLNYKAAYINSTPLGIYGWNLSLLTIDWQTEQMPATTDFENANQIGKVVGFLPISKAVHLSGAMDYKRLDNNDGRQTTKAN
jgi:hypothetical protein